jgi:urate oxidase
MNLILIILRTLVAIINRIPHIDKTVALELNNKYIIEMNVTQFHVKERSTLPH